MRKDKDQKMRCPRCGKEVSNGARICPKCGNSLSQGSTPQHTAKPGKDPKKKKTERYIIYGCAGGVLLCAVVVCGFLLGNRSWKKYQLNKHLTLGNQYLASGDYETAQVEFKEALSIDEQSTQSAIGLARTYNEQEKPEQALEALEIANQGLETSDRLKGMSADEIQKQQDDYNRAADETRRQFEKQGNIENADRTIEIKESGNNYFVTYIPVTIASNPTATPAPERDRKKREDSSEKDSDSYTEQKTEDAVENPDEDNNQKAGDLEQSLKDDSAAEQETSESKEQEDENPFGEFEIALDPYDSFEDSETDEAEIDLEPSDQEHINVEEYDLNRDDYSNGMTDQEHTDPGDSNEGWTVYNPEELLNSENSYNQQDVDDSEEINSLAENNSSEDTYDSIEDSYSDMDNEMEELEETFSEKTAAEYVDVGMMYSAVLAHIRYDRALSGGEIEADTPDSFDGRFWNTVYYYALSESRSTYSQAEMENIGYELFSTFDGVIPVVPDNILESGRVTDQDGNYNFSMNLCSDMLTLISADGNEDGSVDAVYDYQSDSGSEQYFVYMIQNTHGTKPYSIQSIN